MIEKRRLELFRLFPIGGLSIKTIEVGSGELRCGNYQFAVRFANSQNGESTKFSLFTNPVSISDVSKSGKVSGLIGGKTNKSILLSVNAAAQEVIQYDVYQIAVIENNDGNPAFSTNVSLSQFYKLDAQSFEFEYSSNDKFDSVDLAEVSIDDAAIKTFKTLTTKNNKLVGGNVTYKKLEYDRGVPTVVSGNIVEKNIPVRQGFDKASSELKGYFSSEVYRFAVSYWDEYGNFSVPSALDMGAVVGNQFVGDGFKDMKFPSRSNGDGELVRDIGGVVHSVAKGIKLSITNHPSWARGMVVLRAERKKDILFQSPLVPTTVIQSPDAVFDFPGDGRKLPSVFGTIAPKNMMKSNNHGILRSKDKINVEYKENYNGYEYCKKVHLAFPPEAIYNNATIPYATEIPKGGLTIEAIDYASLRPIAQANLNDEIEKDNLGNTIESSTHVTFAATNAMDYASGSKNRNLIRSELSQSRPIVDEAITMDLVAESQDRAVLTSINVESPTSYFGAYNDLIIEPEGPYNGYKPDNQKAMLVVSKSNRPDPTHFAFFGVPLGYSTANLETARGRVLGSKTAVSDNANRNHLNFDNWLDSPAPRHYVEIVNFKKGLNDDRYGDPNSVQTFLPTGSFFNNGGVEMNNNAITIDVFGGDCVISPFTFKVHDSHYGVTNIPGAPDFDKDDWGGQEFKDEEDGNVLRRPVPYRAVSSCIGVFLESEVNGMLEEKLFYSNTNVNNSITKTPIPWQNISVAEGNVVSYLGKFYYALKNITSDDFPGKDLNLSNLRMTNIGTSFLDLGSNYDNTTFPPLTNSDLFLSTSSYREARIGFQYLYNPDFSLTNRSKFFISTGAGEERNRTRYDSRLVYSDVKILQTNIEGFSRFRALNFYDLEESKGAVTRILSNKGKMVAVQELAFCYVPFEANIVESADGVQLAVRSAEIIGSPQYIEDYGSRYIRSVVQTPFGIYFADVNNSCIINFAEGLGKVNDLNIDRLIKDLSSPLIDQPIDDKDVVFYSDNRTSKLVMKYGEKAILMNQDSKLIHSVIRMPLITEWQSGMFANSSHLLMGWVVDTGVKERFVVASIDRGTPNSPFGNKGGGFSSFIDDVINPDYVFPKVLDIINFNSVNSQEVIELSSHIHEQTREVLREKQTKNDRREAWYLLNEIREDPPLIGDPLVRFNPKRFRGEYFKIRLSMGLNKLYSYIAKYRISDRRL